MRATGLCCALGAPAKGATKPCSTRGSPQPFRSTPPRRGRHFASSNAMRRSFDPRPREGGDDVRRGVVGGAACFDPRPREGGDSKFPSGNQPTKVSIHAPAKGATIDERAFLEEMRDVSIHAPAKGATKTRNQCRAIRRFDPRPREGGDGDTSGDREEGVRRDNQGENSATIRMRMPPRGVS